MVGSLIYYSDTHSFFDTHYAEIEELRVEFEEIHGEPLPISGDLKNDLAWYAFREIAYRLLAEWELL